MSAKEKKMTKNNAGQSNASACESNLDSRYGEIGISAVAAALPYRSEVKTPTDESMGQQLDKWIAEMAAA
jgi:hypothetical protein